MSSQELLKEILNIEYEMSILAIEKQRLGVMYIEKNFDFKINDVLKIKDCQSKTHFVKIIKLWFNSHSQVKGLVSFLAIPVNFKTHAPIQNRNAIKFGDEPLKSIELKILKK